jgi:NAD-dependent dihydropyrimidine dehydrogenase PreA subunit
MDNLKFAAAYIVETLLRLFPFPAKTGLFRIGNPGRNSPVFVTGNYHLTILHVKRALQGKDAFLLVANSRGINVWCAAAGGHLTNHDVISVLKTSGIDELVDDRKVVLPQLAAAGVEAQVIQEKTGWKVVWGPVYARNIPQFLESDFVKTPAMRTVSFPFTRRLEMAVAWAFPVSVIAFFILLGLWRAVLFPLILLIWTVSLALFLLFPLYSGLLITGRKEQKSSFINFEHGGLQAISLSVIIAAIAGLSLLTGVFTWPFILGWSIISLVLIIILTADLTGSTPVYKSGMHPDRFFSVRISEEKCRGVAFCEDVCPRNCYYIDQTRHLAEIPRADDCVQCGACIIQCPFDALFFENTKGERIQPETIRRFKLNLLGTRTIKEKER